RDGALKRFMPNWARLALLASAVGALVAAAVWPHQQNASIASQTHAPQTGRSYAAARALGRTALGEPARSADRVAYEVRLCQALGPAAPHPVRGVDCADGRCGEAGWEAMRQIPWQAFAQGEYVGHERTPHVEVYRVRVDDRLGFVYRLTREETGPYEL